MASESSAARKVFQMLISLAIQRCRQSGILCRLTVSIKCFHELEAPSMRISVSDTGVGSSLEEFRTMDLEAHLYPWDKWDGLLSITTTSINEKDIHCYRLNLQETVFSRRRLKRLPSISKQFGTFSGTEVYFSTNEENTDEFVTWVVHFVQKVPSHSSSNDSMLMYQRIRYIFTPNAMHIPRYLWLDCLCSLAEI
ncbi:hypothetical protein MA16_Dca013508 [Dendrobium catenatum]|uniref:Uncharacterized protein n=1 Tax=Dendrobium catenatum TaxID=906689 RepID=A0A2I0W4A5_9ASPA|nr:hypothetical protein MA16_Dca013508 [Dendrobium catenatum]